MTSSKQRLSRILIVLGFTLVALSTVIFITKLLSQRIYGESSLRWHSQFIVQMLSPIFAAGGWWFLSQLEARDSAQRPVLAKAYFFLGLQFSASFIGELIQWGSPNFRYPSSAQFWTATLGFGVGAIGFFLGSRVIARVDLTMSDP